MSNFLPRIVSVLEVANVAIYGRLDIELARLDFPEVVEQERASAFLDFLLHFIRSAVNPLSPFEGVIDQLPKFGSGEFFYSCHKSKVVYLWANCKKNIQLFYCTILSQDMS